MGQQIQIAATAADEESFLAFLRESADIQLFVPCAPTAEDLWVDGFAPFAPYHMQSVLSGYMSNSDNCLWPGISGVGAAGNENA